MAEYKIKKARLTQIIKEEYEFFRAHNTGDTCPHCNEKLIKESAPSLKSVTGFDKNVIMNLIKQEIESS
jgi:uncharacterized protein with PIN domain